MTRGAVLLLMWVYSPVVTSMSGTRSKRSKPHARLENDELSGRLKGPFIAKRRHKADSSPVRTAFCVNGEIRSMTSPVVYLSTVQNLFEGFGTSYDVFIHLALNPNPAKNPFGLQYRAVPLDELNRSLTIMGPRKISWDRKTYCNGLAGQAARLYECQTLIEEAEAEDGRQYDWIARVRTDNVYLTPWITHTQINELGLGGFIERDWVYVFRRNIMAKAFGMPPDYLCKRPQNCCFEDYMFGQLSFGKPLGLYCSKKESTKQAHTCVPGNWPPFPKAWHRVACDDLVYPLLVRNTVLKAANWLSPEMNARLLHMNESDSLEFLKPYRGKDMCIRSGSQSSRPLL